MIWGALVAGQETVFPLQTFGQRADMNLLSAGSATMPSSGLGHAKQDLNNKLDNAAPGIGVHTC